MNELDKIFENNKELLNTKEVKELIEYFQKVHSRNIKIATKFKDFHDRTLEKLMYSELILKNGKGSKYVLTEILKDINEV